MFNILLCLSSKTCLPLPSERDRPAVRRCLWGVCQRTPQSSSSWRCLNSAEVSSPSARARRTSVTSASLRSTQWTRPSSCQVRATPAADLYENGIIRNNWNNYNAYIMNMLIIYYIYIHANTQGVKLIFYHTCQCPGVVTLAINIYYCSLNFICIIS